MTLGSPLVSLKVEDEATTWVTMAIVGGEGRAGNRHREMPARWDTEGDVPIPALQSPCTAGMVPHSAPGQQNNIVSRDNPTNPSSPLAPSSPLLSATFLLPRGGTAELGDPFALVIFSLGLSVVGATYNSSAATPGPAQLCQSPGWAKGARL